MLVNYTDIQTHSAVVVSTAICYVLSTQHIYFTHLATIILLHLALRYTGKENDHYV